MFSRLFFYWTRYVEASLRLVGMVWDAFLLVCEETLFCSVRVCMASLHVDAAAQRADTC